MCSERVTITWSASPLGGHAPAAVADAGDRREAAPPRLDQRGDHAARVAAGGERDQRVAGPAVGDHLAREDRVGADVVGERGDDRRVLGEVERAPRRPAARAAARGSRPRRPSRRSPSRRCRARAACRRRRGARAARAAAACSVVAALEQRLLAQRADLLGLHRHRGGDVGDHRLEVGLLLAQERIEEARRAGVVHLPRVAPLEQPAVLEEHVHELPQQVVERLGQLLAHERVRRSAAPTRAAGRSRGSPSPPPRRPRRAPPRRPRRPARCRRARRAARPARRAARPPPRARPRAARACRRSPGGRTRPRRGARPSAPPARRRARRAGRRARSARPSRWQRRAMRSASAAKKRRFASVRSARSASTRAPVAAPELTPGRPPCSPAPRGTRAPPRAPPPCAR